MKLPSSLNSRWLRWLWRVLLALVGLYALYLVAGNLFLNTPIGPSTINRKPEKFQMHWDSGSTWWPGQISLSGVKLHGHVRHTQWVIQADSARGRIALLSLLGKELRFPQVWANEVTGSVEKVETEQPVPAPRPGGWTLRFDRIASDSVRGGNLAGLELQGKGSAAFGFTKQLSGGPMEVLPSTARFTDTSLSHGGQEWMRDGVLQVEFSIARHLRAEAPGIEKLRLTDAHLKLDGVTAAMDVSTDMQGKVTVKGIPGKGSVYADLGLARGVLEPGSQLRWQMPLTSTDAKDVVHRDVLETEFSVDQDLRLVAKVPSQAGGVLGLDADLKVRGNQLPLADFHFRSFLPRTSGHVSGQWHFASLRWLAPLVTEAPWLTLDGAGSVSADLQVVDGKVADGSKFSVPEVAVVAEVMGNRIKGLARADGTFTANAKGQLLPALKIVVEEFNIAANDNLATPYVRGRDLRLDLEAGEDLAALGDSLRARLTFKNASLPDLRVYNRYLPNHHLQIDGGSGMLSGDLRLDAAGDIGEGWIRMAASKARMRVAGIAMRGDLGIDTQLRRLDLAKRNFAVDGSSIRLDNISFSEPDGETRSGWWARIKLPRARMDWDKPLAVEGNAEVSMKDVGFLLSLFSRQRDYPGWVFKLVDAGQAQVTGRVRWRGDTLVLDRVVASNERFELMARMRLRGQQRNGSLYAKWRKLSVGVQMERPKNRFHLIQARQWYDSQPPLLP